MTPIALDRIVPQLLGYARKPLAQPTRAYVAGLPSLKYLRISARISGVSLCPWTATACCTAASSNSLSLSAEIATVQLLSLGASRQSMNLRVMKVSWSGSSAVHSSGAAARTRVSALRHSTKVYSNAGSSKREFALNSIESASLPDHLIQ